MLASAVLPDAAERGEVRPLGQILPLLRERGVRAVSANGVLGDPAGASAAEGEQMLAGLVNGLSSVMDQFLERSEAEGTAGPTRWPQVGH